MSVVRRVLDAGCIVGESLVWNHRSGELLWVDMLGHRIHALAPQSGAHRTWQTPGMVTSIGLRDDGGAVVGLEERVTLWDFGDTFDTLAVVEPDLADNRLNEGAVGPDGAYWVGTMQNNVTPDGLPTPQTRSSGQIYRITRDGRVEAMTQDRFGSVNTLAWPEGRLLTADTPRNEIYAYRRDPVTGRLSDRRTILTDHPRGLPDGSCLDAAGYLWNCRVVGGKTVLRLAPDGAIDREVELPCSWPTSCAFGGPDLATLYVTSARFTMVAAHLADAPWEGDLFSVQVDARGSLPHEFAM